MLQHFGLVDLSRLEILLPSAERSSPLVLLVVVVVDDCFVVGWQLARVAGWRRCGGGVVLELTVVIDNAINVRAVEKEEGEDTQQAKDKQKYEHWMQI